MKLRVNVLKILLHDTQYIARVLRLVGDMMIHNVLQGAPPSYMLLHDGQPNIMS